MDQLAVDTLPGYENLSASRRLVLLREAIRRVVADAQDYVLDHVSSDEMSPRNEKCRVAAAGETIRLHHAIRFSRLLAKRKIENEDWEKLKRNPDNKGIRKRSLLSAGMWVARDSAQTGRRHEDQLLESLEKALGHYLSSPKARKDLAAFLDVVTSPAGEAIGVGTAADAPGHGEDSELEPVASVQPADQPTSVQPRFDRKKYRAELADRYLRHRFGQRIHKVVFISGLLAILLWVIVGWLAPVPASPPLLPVLAFALSIPFGWWLPWAYLLLAFLIATFLRSIRNRLARLAGRLVSTFTVLATLAYCIAYIALSYGDTDEYNQLHLRSQNVETVNFEDFISSSRCNVLRQPDLRQCNIKDGFMQLAVARDYGEEVLLYPHSSGYANLSGDFFAETRFRAGTATDPMSCGLALSPPGQVRQGYFHLVQVHKNRYIAEFVGRDSLVLTKSEDRRGVYAESSAELPYIGKSRVFDSYLSHNSDEQYDDDEDWIKLTISREADVYKFFVSERLAATYSSNELAPVSVHLAVISGIANPGGATTCDFDYFTIYARP